MTTKAKEKIAVLGGGVGALSAAFYLTQQPGWAEYEANAFAKLRDLIVREAQLSPAHPRHNVLEDQIIWARSPVRLDLAGGWTDTPPYCIEFGGCVLNVATNLNGQPPVQVFAKVCERPELVVRSIDLGVEERLHSYAELDTFSKPGSAFALGLDAGRTGPALLSASKGAKNSEGCQPQNLGTLRGSWHPWAGLVRLSDVAPERVCWLWRSAECDALRGYRLHSDHVPARAGHSMFLACCVGPASRSTPMGSESTLSC